MTIYCLWASSFFVFLGARSPSGRGAWCMCSLGNACMTAPLPHLLNWLSDLSGDALSYSHHSVKSWSTTVADANALPADADAPPPRPQVPVSNTSLLVRPR